MPGKAPQGRDDSPREEHGEPGTAGFPGGLTVLMAVWRRDDPDLFEAAVNSAFCGTVRPDEFILVVDGPVHGRLDAAVTSLATSHRLVVLRLPENVGLARALNQGLRRVQTAWVARADADDINLPDRFEKQANAIRSAADGIDVLGGAIAEVERSGEIVALREVPLTSEAIARRVRTRNPFNHMTVVYRTSAVVSAGGYPEVHLKEDYALWASLISRGARCRNLPDVLVHASGGIAMYRRRGGLRYVASELSLQAHLHRLGLNGPIRGLITAIGRSAAFLMPARVRGWIYERVLRRKVGKQVALPSNITR